MKAAILNDLHYGVRQDSKFYLDHLNTFLRDTFWPYVLKNKIKLIIILGDIMDKRKLSNHAIVKSVRENLFDVARYYNINIITSLGNHDCYYRNTNFPNSTRLLFCDYDNIVFVEDYPLTLNDYSITIVPWINPTNEYPIFEYLKNDTSNVLMGHFEIIGFPMSRGNVARTGHDRNLFSKYSKVLSGHFHHRSNNGNIYYLGSQYEMTWEDYNDPKGFHVFDMKTYDLEFIQNPVTIYKKIRYDKEMTVEEISSLVESSKNSVINVQLEYFDNKENLDMFVAQMKGVEGANVKINEKALITSTDNEIELDDEIEDTLSIIKKYVDKVETSLDKTQLSDMVVKLYKESLS